MSTVTYTLQNDHSWCHLLYGAIPGQKIDWIYFPNLDDRILTPQQCQRLNDFSRRVEPYDDRSFVFSIVNLSQYDTRHKPGRGALAVVFSFRILNVRDHGDRIGPKFVHGIACADCKLDADMLLASTVKLH